MRKLFIFVIFLCANLSAKSQNSKIDSMTSEVIKYIENTTGKKFFSYPKDSLDTLGTTMIFFNEIDSNLVYFFSAKKVSNNFISISILTRSNKKKWENYIFEKETYLYKYWDVDLSLNNISKELMLQNDFLVEINQKHFLEKMEVFFSFLKGQIDR